MDVEQDHNTYALYNKIYMGEFTVPSFVSEDARDLIHSLLQTDPTVRFGLQDIKRHAWYRLAQPIYEPKLEDYF